MRKYFVWALLSLSISNSFAETWVDGGEYIDSGAGSIYAAKPSDESLGDEIIYSDTVFVDNNKILNSALSNYYWLMNSYSDLSVRLVSYDGTLSDNSPAYTNGVRPAWYISNVTVTGGNGTPASPYLLK